MKDVIYPLSTRALFKEKTRQIKKESWVDGKTMLLVYGGDLVEKAGVYDEVAELLQDLDILKYKGAKAPFCLEPVGADTAKVNEEDYLSIYKENLRK